MFNGPTRLFYFGKTSLRLITCFDNTSFVKLVTISEDESLCDLSGGGFMMFEQVYPHSYDIKLMDALFSKLIERLRSPLLVSVLCNRS